MGVNQLVGVDVRLFQHRIVDEEHGELVAGPPGLGLANQGLGLLPDRGRAVGTLNQRVMWSWLNAPFSRRDKYVAVVGPVDLSK